MAEKNLEFNFILVTPSEFAKATGASYKEVLKFCKTGQLEAYQTEGRQWKIKVYKNDVVSKKEYEKLLEERNYYKGTVESVTKLVMRQM